VTAVPAGERYLGGVVTIPVMKPWVGAEEAEAAAEAVTSGWLAQGPRVATFERAVADRVGAVDAVATSSCTTALHLALLAVGVERGDEVIVPSLSFIATANVVRYTGATPVFADVELATQNMTAGTIESVTTPRTKAVIAVHQCGIPADMDDIHDSCDRAGIAVVEDAACAIGSVYKGREIGAHSDQVAFSFHPRKVITTGEGGMLATSKPQWAERLRRLREHGMSVSAAERHQAGTTVAERYLETGFNYRMTDIQAAVGLVQLAKLDQIVRRRRQLGQRYRDELAGLPGVVLAGDPPYGTTNFQSLWMLLPVDCPIGRNDLLDRLLARGISARRGIMASHLEPAYAGHPHADLPVTERVTRHSVILPLFHTMTEEEQDLIIGAVRELTGGPRPRSPAPSLLA
jgi:dTDP-4-amino-4,6-dideoxygalactose transaminase